MQQRKQVIISVLVLLVAALPGFAQSSYEDRPAWHLNGSAGFNFSNMRFNTEQPDLPSRESTNQTIAGDIRVGMTGFLKDPRLLIFSVDATDIEGANSNDSADVRAAGRNYGFVGTLLNGRSFPLTFFYRKSNLDYTGSGASEGNDTTTGGVTWRLRNPRLPQSGISYQWSDYKTDTPLGFSASNSRTRSLRADSSAFLDGWNVGGSVGYVTGHTLTVGNLTLPQPEDTDSKSVEGHSQRGFLDNKLDWTNSLRANWDNDRGAFGTFSDHGLAYASAASLQHTREFSSHYSYAYASSTLDAASPGQIPGGVVILLPSYTEQDVNGGVTYRPAEWLTLGQDLHAVWQSPLTNTGVSTTPYYTPVSSAAVNTTWRAFQLGASGNIGFNIMNSNAGDRATGTNHAEQGNVSWGATKDLRLTGMVNNSHQAIPLIQGAFVDDRRLSMQAETDRLHGYKLSARYDYGWNETLTQAGDFAHRYQMVSAQLSSRRFILTGSQSFGKGYGSVFPGQVIVNQYIYSLPISQLMFSPLLNRVNNGSSLGLSVMLIRNLDVNVLWGRDNNDLFTLVQNYRHLDAYTRYRLGKFSFEFGVFRYTSETETSEKQSNRTNRYYIRIARDFSIF